jgi:ATP-dependent RNA helicase DeaD
MSDDSNKSKYRRVIDLSPRAVAAERAEEARKEFEKADRGLPAVALADLPLITQAAVKQMGWESLTPVQESAIPYLLDQTDLIVQSRTGSGKTGAFLLPLFHLLDSTKAEVQALVLTPTRELARQVVEEFRKMHPADSERQFRSALVYGGVKYGPQIQALHDGAQLVVGTPGRVIDLLERRDFALSGLRFFILDEADEMLSMGFLPAIKELARYLPKKRSSYMFSATMPVKVQSLARDFLQEPGFLSLSAGQESVETIEHQYFVVPPMEKDRILVRLIEMENPESAIIFANTKRDVEYLTNFLRNYGHDADGISGDLTQSAREAVMARLKSSTLRFLVATDVAARGIDVSELGHVFMYDVPQDPEYYIHRSGRTARAGRSGTVVVLATAEDHANLKAMARRYGVELEKHEVPTESEVTARVSERMTILLEERARHKTGLERERFLRFGPVIGQLAREEPELLMMLMDDFYHEQMHARAPDESGVTPAGSYSEQKLPSRGEGKESSRRRGSGRKRGR